MRAAGVILTIEDDAAIRQGIVDSLEFNGYQVLQCGDGKLGLERAIEAEYDLLLLDLALPQVSGFDILKRVREVKPRQPVIILTAKGDESDRVRGLRDGADDYVVKPFSVKELMARVEAVLRRSAERPSNVQRVPFKHGTIDFERRELRYSDQQRAELSEKEAELLHYLVTNQGRAVSREEILSSVWQLSPRGIETRTIDMHIARLRDKLKDNRSRPEILLTVRGKGYMWAAVETQVSG